MTGKRVAFESPAGRHIEGFLAYKRDLGRKYISEEDELRWFDRYLDERELRSFRAVTPDVIREFLGARPRSPRGYNGLLGVIRGLFRWLVARDVIETSPVLERPRRANRVRVPVILRPEQVSHLLELAGQLTDQYQGCLRGPTYRTVFAILYALGLRVGEACRLRGQDIDWDRRVLMIWESKFGKSRLVPFGPRLGKVLRQYIILREQTCGVLAPESNIFSVQPGYPLTRKAVGRTFRRLRSQLGITTARNTSPPRVHDLRASFAVGTLLRWYRSDINPQRRLVYLSTFMGHVDPESTAVYLIITGDLLKIAGERFEDFADAIFPAVAS